MGGGPRKIPNVRFQTDRTSDGDIQDGTRALANALNLLPFAVGRLVSVTFARGGVAQVVTHKLGTRARCFPISLAYDALGESDDPANQMNLWVRRAYNGPGTLTSGAANSTVGARFQVSRQTRIVGARAVWKTSGGAKTLKVSLWRDSTGARLASGTSSSLTSSGIYDVLFDRPILLNGSNLNVDLTIGVYDTAGVNYTYSPAAAEAPFTTWLSSRLLPDVLLKAINLVGAGDSRPTVGAGGEVYWVEPIFAAHAVQASEDPDQSGIDETNQMRLIATAGGTIDLWFYPRASRPIPNGKTTSE